MPTDQLRLDRDGAQLFRAVADSTLLREIRDLLSHLSSDRVGVRLFGLGSLRPLIEAEGLLGAVAASGMRGTPRPVRAILFDKTAAANWSLGWHQDRVIAVRERVDVQGFGPWSRKRGVLHVAPPFETLADMRTLRFHLDPAPAGNAPLLVAPGSHRRGRVAEGDVARAVEECGVAACLAEAGDAWLYATPILHASEAAREPARRRVLQIDYAVGDLPGDLEWAGV